MPHANSHAAAPSTEQLWTRAKCNRLLRPLTLALSSKAGRKIAESDVHPFQERPSSNGDQYMQDATWLGSKSQRRQKLTYANRASRHRLPLRASGRRPSTPTPPHQPGEIVPPTPLLDRVRANLAAQSEHQPPQTPSPNNTWNLNAPNWSPEHPAPRSKKMDAMEAVKVAFKTLLVQTKPHHSSPQKPFGAPSLFNICLRNIPAHIADEQTWREELDPDDRSDASAEVYDLLESLGCGDLEGWRHLSTVVRAHGLHLVQACIRNNALGDLDVRALVKICIQEECPEEARTLFQSWVEMRCPFPLPSSPNTGEFLLIEFLNMLTNSTGNPIPQYRILRNLFKTRELPLAWISTPAFKSLWYKIIVSLSQEDDESRAAVEVIVQILYLATNMEPQTRSRPFMAYWSGKVDPTDSTPTEQNELQSAVINTISSLCTIVSSIACLKLDLFADDTIPESEAHEIQPISLACRATIRKGAQCQDLQADHASLTANRLLICIADAVLIMHNIGCGSRTTFEAFDEVLTLLIQLNTIYNKTHNCASTSNDFISGFICAVIRCYSRIQSRLAFELLKRTAQKMVSFRPRNEDPLGKQKILFIRRLALDTVVRYTEDSQNPEHLRFLHAMEQLMGGPSATNAKQRNAAQKCPTSTHGLRWEEGICEWVAATPASLLKSARVGTPSLISRSRLDGSRPRSNSPTQHGPMTNGVDTSPLANIKNKRAKVDPKQRTESVSMPRPRKDSVLLSKARAESMSIHKLRAEIMLAPKVRRDSHSSTKTRTDSLSSHKTRTDSTSSLDVDRLADSGICLGADKEFKQARPQQRQFEQTFADDDSDEEDELSLPTSAPRQGGVSTRMLGVQQSGKARAYSGLRDAKALAMLKLTDVGSDELS